MKNESKCRKNILCDFERIIDNEQVLIERCKNCGKKVIYNKEIKEFYKNEKGEIIIKRGNKIDDDKYLRDHKRDILQPFGRDRELHKNIYGNIKDNVVFKKYQRKKQTKKENEEKWDDLRRKIKK